ncbi:hypothetical protein HY224_03280 [Candidatus Uhrbacteria bacterium]|nr:hypothetical protein [Candidatus Uhrbacteria bacterium]
MTITQEEKILYHQVHPLKLIIEWSGALLALYFFWQGEMWKGIFMAFLPAVFSSWLVIQWADFKSIKNTHLGQNFKHYLAKHLKALRMLGYLLTVLGAIYNSTSTVTFGLAVIITSWFTGYAKAKKARPIQ